jgi:iron(III) transport system permease protein
MIKRTHLFGLFLVLFFGVFLVYPLLYVFSESFFINNSFTLSLYQLILSSEKWRLITLNSINLACGTTLLAAVLALPLSYLSQRTTLFSPRLLSILILLPMTLPPFVGGVGMKSFLARFGPFNLTLIKLGIISEPFDLLRSGGMSAVVFVQALHLFPIMYLNIAASIAQLDRTLEEAASNLGASRTQLFLRITLPLLSSGIFAGASVVFIWALTDIGTPLVFGFNDLLPIQILNLTNDIHSNPLGYALILYLSTISAGIFFISKKFLSATLTTTAVKQQNLKRELPLSWRIVLIATVTLFFGLALLPHLSVILLTFSKKWFMTILPTSYSTASVLSLFSHPITLNSIKNSLILGVSTTIFSLFIGVYIAHLVTRVKSRFSYILEAIVMSSLLIPGVVFAFGYLGAFSETIFDPKLNPFPLLIIGYTIRRMPFLMRSAIAGFEELSTNLEDAARNLGASSAVTFRRISLPLLASHLVGGAILVFAFSLLEVSESMILALEDRYYPISKAIYFLLNRPDGLPLASALGFFSMIILILCFALSSKLLGKRFESLFR